MAELDPPDREICQAEIPNPDYGPFRMGGSTRKRIPCRNPTAVIVTECEPDEDGDAGSMGLCLSCLAVLNEQMPGHAFVSEVLGAWTLLDGEK